MIADEPSPKIVYADNAFENGVVFAVDPESDLALLKFRENVPLLKWSDNLPLSGEEVIAMGFPLGGGLDGELTPTPQLLPVDGRWMWMEIPRLFNLMVVLSVACPAGRYFRDVEVIGINEASMEAGSIGLAISSSHAIYYGLMLMTPSYLESAIARRLNQTKVPWMRSRRIIIISKLEILKKHTNFVAQFYRHRII